MDFSEALKIIKQGGKVKRRGWGYMYIVFDGNNVQFMNAPKVSYNLTLGESALKASDWEIYKDWSGTYDNEKTLILEHINEFERTVNNENSSVLKKK